MEALWTGITSVISNIITLIGTVTTGLLANEIFQMLIGVVIFSILVIEILKIVFFIKNKGDGCQINFKKKNKYIENEFDIIDDFYKTGDEDLFNKKMNEYEKTHTNNYTEEEIRKIDEENDFILDSMD